MLQGSSSPTISLKYAREKAKWAFGLRAEGFEFNPRMQAGGDADPAGPTPTTSTSMTHMVHILN